MAITIIAAIARNGVIGRDNRLIWHIPRDLRRFKRLTMGHALIMGRKTFDSIGRPLPGRRNIVITRQSNFAPDGVEVVHSLEQALALVGDAPAFVIGGGEIYRQALPRAERLELTLVDADFEGDVRFPEIDWREWTEAERRTLEASESVPFDYSFCTFVRR